MMLLGVKAYLTLLWGTSVLFSTESESASIPETGSNSSLTATAPAVVATVSTQPSRNMVITGAAEPTAQPAQQQPATSSTDMFSPQPSHNPVITAEPTKDESQQQSGTTSDDATAPATALATVAMFSPQPSHHTAITEAAEPTQHQPAATSADMKPPATAPATALATVAMFSPQPSHHMAITEAAEPTQHQPAATSAGVMPPTTVAMFSTHPTSTAKPDVTSKLSSSTTPDYSAPRVTSGPPASSGTTLTTNPASEVAPVLDHTSLPVRINQTSSTPQPSSDTRTHVSTPQSPHTRKWNSTAATNDSSISTSIASASPAGILIPHVTTRSPVPATRSSPATAAAPCEASKSPPSTNVQPCSTRGVVKHCLIAIASLAGLATIFMVSTIILCTKLTARKYRVKKPQQATEMMCISALLPDRTYTYTRQRNPISNGVLVFPSSGDSDEDVGDNLTLSSFLPENDRFV